MTTHGVLARESGRPLEVVELNLPSVGDTDVRVRVAAAGICHTDLSAVNGTISPVFPLVLGHEASGEVIECGPLVEDVSVGDHVVLNWAPPCRSCWHCTRDEPWLCSRNAGVTSIDRGVTTAAGEPVHACIGLGALAEEVVLPADFVVPLPPSIPLDVAALLGCAVLTGFGAAVNGGHIRAGDSAVVIGLGGVGLSAVAGARMAGASPIIAVDVSDAKAELAAQQGADHFVPAGDELARSVRALTDGRGADHVFDCVGSASTIRTAWSLARRGGRATVVGVGRRTEEFSFNPLEFFHFSRVLTSSIFGSSDPEVDIPVLCGHIAAGGLDLSALVTHRVDLHGVQAAFDRMVAGEGGRTLVVM